MSERRYGQEPAPGAQRPARATSVPAPPPPPGGVPACRDTCELSTRCQHFGLCRVTDALTGFTELFRKRTDGRRL